jgi:DNA-directed RNA polymerase subunit RPC12/RpoP
VKETSPHFKGGIALRVTCPKCGAGSRALDGTKKIKCQVCGTKIQINYPTPTPTKKLVEEVTDNIVKSQKRKKINLNEDLPE